MLQQRSAKRACEVAHSARAQDESVANPCVWKGLRAAPLEMRLRPLRCIWQTHAQGNTALTMATNPYNADELM
eukprot:15446289-Alexandrium_andersonii.AAC.1